MSDISPQGSDLSGDVSATALTSDNGYVQNQTDSVVSSEKMIPQSRVDEIVRESNRRGYAKGQSEALTKMQNPQHAPQSSSPSSEPSMGGMPQVSAEHIQAMVQQQLKQELEYMTRQQREQQEKEQFQKMLQTTEMNFENAMKQGKEKYADYDQVAGSVFDFTEGRGTHRLAMVTHYISALDNAADVMYELGKNTAKLSQLTNTLFDIGEHRFQQDLSVLSASLKANQAALQQKHNHERPPIEHISPSNYGTDSGERTLEDWKNHPSTRF